MPSFVVPFSYLAFINEWTLPVAIFIVMNCKVRKDFCQLFEAMCPFVPSLLGLSNVFLKES